MRDALGALGPVDGLNPELSNLTCRWRKVLYAIFISLPFSITEVLPGDIVFLTSDGISDNFDPVVNLNLILINETFESAPGAQVGKFCVPKKPDRQGSTGSRGARTPGREPLR